MSKRRQTQNVGAFRPNKPGLLCGWRRVAVAAAVAGCIGVASIQAHGQAVRTPDQEDSDQEDYHVVEQGDTLWDLSARFYGENYEWPRLWSYNAHITNPHWIYPGDIVYRSEPPSKEDVEEKEDDDDRQRISRAQGSEEEEPDKLYVALGGYVSAEEPQYVGRIAASTKEAVMLTEHDKAWVGWGEDAYTEEEQEELDDDEIYEMRDPDEITKGDRFSIVREAGDVKKDGEVVAKKYRVLGTVEVRETNEDHYDEVRITQAWQEIERGDLLVPYERQVKQVQQREADKDQVAEIVDSLRRRTVFGEHNYVFINSGAADGVRPGNRFFIYQHHEGLHKPDRDGELDERVPWTRVGQVMVIDVLEEYSTAIVTDSKREIMAGDRLEMYDGH
ncbi:MAG: LysM peptidoglycan-binding domain-containing protein [Persicimonas sp.]